MAHVLDCRPARPGRQVYLKPTRARCLCFAESSVTSIAKSRTWTISPALRRPIRGPPPRHSCVDSNEAHAVPP